MEELRTVSFEKFDSICRICFSEDEEEMFSIREKIFDKNQDDIAHTIGSIADIEIVPNDGLPENICNLCKDKVRELDKFRSLIRDSDRILRRTFQKHKGKKNVKEELRVNEDSCMEVDDFSMVDSKDEDSDDSSHVQKKQTTESKLENNEFMFVDVSMDVAPSIPSVKSRKRNSKLRRESNERSTNMSDSEDETGGSSQDIWESGRKAMNVPLPIKTEEKYRNAYTAFMKWTETKKFENGITQDALLAYVSCLQIERKLKPPSLCATISMIKAVVLAEHDIDISKFPRLTRTLKSAMNAYVPKQLKTLSHSQIRKFLVEAPDDKFLASKAIIIFGISGACHREELTNITTNDIKHEGETMIVNIPSTKNKSYRTFVIDGEFREIVEKYERVRPTYILHNRFFLNYNNGRCTQQFMGRNKMGKVPTEIAKFLNLPDPQSYTGHCFRRSSATLLAEAGGSLATSKGPALGLTENERPNEGNISSQIQPSLSSPTSESNGGVCKRRNTNRTFPCRDGLTSI